MRLSHLQRPWRGTHSFRQTSRKTFGRASAGLPYPFHRKHRTQPTLAEGTTLASARRTNVGTKLAAVRTTRPPEMLATAMRHRTRATQAAAALQQTDQLAPVSQVLRWK